MKDPLVSIILPTYNRANVIKRAVKSVKEQKYKNWELVIVDDGSTDSTPKVLQKLSEVDSRIKVLRQVNLGLSAARNLGSEKSKGQLLAYLDDDDYYLPDHLTCGVNYLIKHPEVAMIYSGVKVIGSSYVPDARNPRRRIRVSKCGHPGTFIIWRRILKELGGWPGSAFGEDYRLRMNLRRLKHKVVKLACVNYVYDWSLRTSITKQVFRIMGKK